MKARAFLLSMLILGVASPDTLPQNAVSGVVVLKFSWDKVRISPISSVASLASQDELIQRSKQEQQLAAARNSSNKAAASNRNWNANND